MTLTQPRCMTQKSTPSKIDLGVLPVQEQFKPMGKWWKDLLGGEVSAVKVSRRLAKTPAIVVAGEYGWTANMERIIMAQAISGSQQEEVQAKRGARVLEVNARHPLVEELYTKVSPLRLDKCISHHAALHFTLLHEALPKHHVLGKGTSCQSVEARCVDFNPSLALDELGCFETSGRLDAHLSTVLCIPFVG